MSRKRKYTYKSGLERVNAEWLEDNGVEFKYESLQLPYIKRHVYRPDFILPNGIIVETKGKFTSQDRSKHLCVRDAHPELDIRFVFGKDNYMTKRNVARYSDWCTKHGFKYALGRIPEEWMK